MKLVKLYRIIIIPLFCLQFEIAGNGITSQNEGIGGGIGGHISSFAFAVLLSQEFGLKLYNPAFPYVELFNIATLPSIPKGQRTIFVRTEDDIKKNLNKKNILFITSRGTKVKSFNKDGINLLKQLVSPKKNIVLSPLPTNTVTIAVHIRKGNNPLKYDGALSSQQLFDLHNKVKIVYNRDFHYYSFDPACTYARRPRPNKPHRPNKQQIDNQDGWETKFPPEQFYIDQLNRVARDLSNYSLFVRIFTDDQDPDALLKRIKNHVHEPNVYFDDSTTAYTDDILKRMADDVCDMARFDILIRSQSYFPRVAELIGNHKIVIFPLDFEWRDNKLIMKEIVINGDYSSLK